VEDRGIEPRAHGLGNQSGYLRPPPVTMRKAKKKPLPVKAQVKPKQEANRPPSKHQKDFEALLDLAVRGEK